MLRRVIADRLFCLIINRFRKEQPQRELTKNEMSGIWFGIYGKLCRGESEAEVEEWCKTVPFVPIRKVTKSQ